MPWLFGDINITGFRAWNALLFTVPYFLLGLAVLSPRREKPVTWLLFGLWAMLFLNQGPIYTPLVLAAILVALARRSPLWLAFIFTAVAGYFAQLARETWLFAPAMWAVMIYMLEKPPIEVETPAKLVYPGLNGLRTASNSWKRRSAGSTQPSSALPACWAVISTGRDPALVAQSAERRGGIRRNQHRKSLRQGLPPTAFMGQVVANSTYAPGIVWGLVMAAGALVILLVYLALPAAGT